ncbi:MAG: DUF5069 domain-containing protein [Opitutus sp.]
MSHYDFASDFRALYDHAVDRYASGVRTAGSLFDERQLALLTANGITAQHLFDYAEDHHGYGGEPGFERALAIEAVRRDYFLNVQQGRPSGEVLDESSLPAKTAALRGIEWLPRILPKARAKLRGELPASIMYCCGGDRQFLKRHDIFPAEFLTLVWRNENVEAAIVEWVVRRSRSA